MPDIQFLLTVHVDGDLQDIPTLKENILDALEHRKGVEGISSDEDENGFVTGFSAEFIDTQAGTTIEDQIIERLDALEGQLILDDATNNPEYQDATDELCYEYLGTGKHVSELNNQGYRRQLEALTDTIGIYEVERLVHEILEA